MIAGYVRSRIEGITYLLGLFLLAAVYFPLKAELNFVALLVIVIAWLVLVRTVGAVLRRKLSVPGGQGEP